MLNQEELGGNLVNNLTSRAEPANGQRLAGAVAINYTPAHEQGGGIGRYVRELVAALAAYDSQSAYRLFVMGTGDRKFGKAQPSPVGANFEWRSSSLTPLTFARLWHRARLPIPVDLWTGPIRLFHETDFVLPPTLPWTRTLLTVHDLSFVRVPDAAPPSLKAYLDATVPRSVQRADHILADSQATKDDLIALYGTPLDKISVLLSGVTSRFNRDPVDPALRARLRAEYHLGDFPFILAIGTVQPRKNYERIIRALAALPDDLRETRLVIVGGKGWLESPIYRAVEELGLQDRVIFTGFMDDELLPTLYKLARCLAFPSLYEGFGLPILEAMACGTPVLTAGISSMLEVAGDATILVDPLSVEQIREGLAALLSDQPLREQLIAAGVAQAARFTWQQAAAQLYGIYARLLG